jgi:HK97 family phage prohead protease
MHQDFRLTFNLPKTYKADDDHVYVEDIASGTEVDLTGERMSVEALKSMVESLKSGLVEFRSEHSHEWDASIGEIVSLSLNDDNKLVYKAKLDLGYSKARDLVHAIEKGRQLGVSIGASVIKAGMEWAEEVGKSVYTYFELALKEISVTGTAAYQYSWINQVTKSLDRNALLMPSTKSESLQRIINQTLCQDILLIISSVTLGTSVLPRVDRSWW